MTTVHVRVPLTFSIEMDGLSDVFTQRMVQAFTALRHSVCKFDQSFTLPAEVGGGDVTVRFSKIDSDKAVVSWEQDPELGCYTAWNTLGQRIDTRGYSLEAVTLSDTSPATAVMVTTTDTGEATTIALCSSKEMADAIGNAFDAGSITVHPRHAYP